MRCIVTAGATYEPLDSVRRLTNFSTGKLGADLAQFLCARGHQVELLLGESAFWRGQGHPAQVSQFTTSKSLLERFTSLSLERVGAVFHAAAVGDFQFGRILSGEKEEIAGVGKIPTCRGKLMVELVPAPKLLPELRGLFPTATLVGWKYEVDGTRHSALNAGWQQIAGCQTDACVVNGPAYGPGFGVLLAQGGIVETPDHLRLYDSLARLLVNLEP